MANQPKTIYITYFDKVDQLRVKHLMSIISQLIANEKPDSLYFLIASQGGEVDAGIVFYNFLKSLHIKVAMHNIGSIDSIANVIFVAGHKRLANPHSTFLFHGVQWNPSSSTPLSLPQINEMQDRIRKDHNKIAGILCENTKLKENDLKNLFREGETKDAKFALQKGIINKIQLAQIPKDALFVSININN